MTETRTDNDRRPVLQIFASATWGGGEQFVADLSRRLLADGRPVTLVARRSRAIAERAAEIGAPLHRLPLKGIPDLLSGLLLARLLLRYRPAVIHVHHFKDAFTALYARAIARLFGLRPRIVLTRHLVRPGKCGWLHNRMYRSLDRTAFVSELARREFFATEPKMDPARTSVIHNSSPAKSSGSGLPDLRKDYGLAPDVPIALYCGRLVEEKGCDVLLRAAKLLDDKRFVLFLAGAGDDAYVKSLQESAAGATNRTVFLGFVKDAGRLFAQADIGVIPTVQREAFGLSVIEAMQCGCPVVTTDNGAQSEYIENGRNGILTPPGDAGALADALARLLDDDALRRSVGAAGRNCFEERLSYEHFYKKYLDLYDA